MKLRLFTLGQASATIGDRTIDASAELSFAGLLLLGLEAGREFGRDDMASLLWPDAPHSRQAERLRWLLSKLRAFGLPIRAGTTYVSLSAADVELDFAAADRAEPEVIGAVLPAYQPDISTPFARWLSTTRDRIATETLRALIPRLSAATRKNDWGLASRLASAIQRVDPLNEEAALALAEAQCRLGAKAQALAGLEAYLDALGDDRPKLELPAKLLHQRIKSDDDTMRRLDESSFVGRTEQIHRVTALLTAAHAGAGGAVVLTGPAGIGKTSIVDEALARAALSSMQIVRVRCQARDTARPLSALTDLAPQVLGLRGALGAAPAAFTRLSQFVNPQPRAEASAEQPSPEWLRAQLGGALLDVLEAASSETPVAIVIDDIQWAHRSLAWFWDDIIPWSGGHPVALAFTCRAVGSESPPVVAQVVPVPSLDGAAANDLLDTLIASGERVPTREVRAAILARGAGSPLFLRELVRQWLHTGALDALPDSLAGLLDAGVNALSATALRALEAAAILGTYASLERVERVTQTQRGAFIDAIVELHAAGILSSDAKGQVFGHVLWAEVALKRQSAAVASLLHRYSAECLQDELPTMQEPGLFWEIARHWQDAGQPDRARGVIARGAEHLAQSGFPDEAARVYRDAADQAGDPAEQLRLLRRCVELFLTAGRMDDLRAAIEHHERLAVALDPEYDRHNDFEIELILADFLRSNDADATIAATLACVNDHKATSSHRLRAAKECARMARLVAPPAFFDELRHLIAQVVPTTPEDHWNRDRFEFQYALGVGNVQDLVGIADRFLVAWRNDANPRRAAAAMGTAALVYEFVGRFADARAMFRETAKFARKHGVLEVESGAYDDLIGLSLDTETPAVVRALIEEARAPILMMVKYGARHSELRNNHEAQLAILEGKYEEALRLTLPLDDALRIPVARWRARFLGVHLAARQNDDRDEQSARIADALLACFDTPGTWLDWPAAVLAEYLERARSAQLAAEFAHRFVTTIRRELYPPPRRLGELSAQFSSSTD